MLEFCEHLRIAGIGSLFLEGTSEGLLRRLSQSGRAFGHFQAGAPEDSQRTRQCAPFFDAVAADDLEGAAQVARHARREWAQGVGYEGLKGRRRSCPLRPGHAPGRDAQAEHLVEALAEQHAATPRQQHLLRGQSEDDGVCVLQTLPITDSGPSRTPVAG
jgi:hypothetical protein